MELPINVRLKAFTKKQRLKQYEVAHSVGAVTTTISNMMNMKAAPSCNLLQGFAHGFPYLNMNWVFRGEGEMYLEDSEESSVSDIDRVQQLETMLKDKERIIAEKERYIQLLEATKQK